MYLSTNICVGTAGICVVHAPFDRFNPCTLSFQIWDLSDPSGRGYLDKEGLFVSLKLVALAQAGHDINMRNIFIEPPNPPKVVRARGDHWILHASVSAR